MIFRLNSHYRSENLCYTIFFACSKLLLHISSHTKENNKNEVPKVYLKRNSDSRSEPILCHFQLQVPFLRTRMLSMRIHSVDETALRPSISAQLKDIFKPSTGNMVYIYDNEVIRY